MLRQSLAVLTLSLSAAAAAEAAAPQPHCGARAEILAHLAERYEEKPQALGLLADGGLLEVVVSPKGSWTIIISYPKGPSCVMAIGSDWRQKMILAGRPI